MAIMRRTPTGKAIVLVLGWGFIVLGFLGLFPPIPRGILVRRRRPALDSDGPGADHSAN